ncbi:MAG: hypothetical protein HYU56_01745 [Candidatus Aenigmarchaeota archaeon]|nr:hypothetical protein [Candidatus Aenigmarchaeota archaeon]
MKKLAGTLTCPECGHKQKMEIPKKVCMHFYKCEKCKKLIKGKDKCIFCSYADRKCPSGCLR